MNWIAFAIIVAVPVVLAIAMLAGGKIGYALGRQAEKEEHALALRLSKTGSTKTES